MWNRLVKKVRIAAKKNHQGGSCPSLDEATTEIDWRYTDVDDLDINLLIV